jgi:hypothetical protein
MMDTWGWDTGRKWTKPKPKPKITDVESFYAKNVATLPSESATFILSHKTMKELWDNCRSDPNGGVLRLAIVESLHNPNYDTALMIFCSNLICDMGEFISYESPLRIHWLRLSCAIARWLNNKRSEFATQVVHVRMSVAGIRLQTSQEIVIFDAIVEIYQGFGTPIKFAQAVNNAYERLKKFMYGKPKPVNMIYGAIGNPFDA